MSMVASWPVLRGAWRKIRARTAEIRLSETAKEGKETVPRSQSFFKC